MLSCMTKNIITSRHFLLLLCGTLALGAPCAAQAATVGLGSAAQWQKYAAAACLTILPNKATCTAISTSTVPDTGSYAAPLTITHGGTYTGEWRSNSSTINAVTINTSEPVTITNSKIAGPGNLIYGRNVNLTVTNTIGYGIGSTPGKFADLTADKSIDIDHCILTNVWGIRVSGQATIPTVKINNNFGYNMHDGLEKAAHFVQLAGGTYTNSSISNNISINAPYQSHVEDVINIYDARGTAASPITISSNKIVGAYALLPESQGFSGGGIIVDGAANATSDTAAAYINISTNTVLETSNYGLAIAYGHNNHISNNVVLSTGVIDGSIGVAAQNVGLYVWNMGKQSPTVFFNNTAYANKIVWMKPKPGAVKGTNDWWLPDCDNSNLQNCSDTVLASTPDINAAIALENSYLFSMFGNP